MKELLGPKYNFWHCPWEGSTPTPIIDQHGHVITVLAGHPNNPNWTDLHQQAAETLEMVQPQCNFSDKQRKHQRGRFPALSYGISYGSSQTHPQGLHHNKDNTAMLIALISNLAFIRLAGFVSSSLLPPPLILDPELVVFDTPTPTTCCSDGVPSLHLVLWDLKLIIDFPPGSTILIPSAILRHSNTTIAPGECRYLFTQYTAGGLFRWVDYGFRGSEEYWGALQGEELEQVKKERSERWMMGMGMFSTLEELRQ
ncbi:hypothetical protein ARMSODRAFT_990947 [Armillaria solidipes]|uniref:Uncharacterized protein n=1 Tax=Armillaria solidipes TaxID=1076256 RepID=A0A2H3AZX5_9AGAR|nr:hypothetical protein ARMSODRAFT_990947 [Armillaria solidipes]